MDHTYCTSYAYYCYYSSRFIGQYLFFSNITDRHRKYYRMMLHKSRFKDSGLAVIHDDRSTGLMAATTSLEVDRFRVRGHSSLLEGLCQSRVRVTRPGNVLA